MQRRDDIRDGRDSCFCHVGRLEMDGKVTQAYPNGDVVTRFPDGVVKKTSTAGVSTTWHRDGSVESSLGDHTQTWDASTGAHMDRTFAATITYEANGSVTEVRGAIRR